MKTLSERPSNFCNPYFDFSLFLSTRYSSPRSNGAVEKISSQTERNPIPDFGRHHSSYEADMDRMIRTTRPYLRNEFSQSEHARQEYSNSCEYIPSSNMTRHHTLLYDIPLYVDRNVTLTNSMLDHGKQLAWLLAAMAKQVFHLPRSTIHLFRDIDSGMLI